MSSPLIQPYVGLAVSLRGKMALDYGYDPNSFRMRRVNDGEMRKRRTNGIRLLHTGCGHDKRLTAKIQGSASSLPNPATIGRGCGHFAVCTTHSRYRPF